MYVSAGRAVGRVDVGVSVDPDQANFLVLTTIKFRYARNRPRRDGMIAAQSNRHLAGFQRLHHEFRVLGAGRGDLLQIFCVGIAFFLLLGNGDGDVSGVFDNVTERLQSRFETSDPHCRGTHIDAAARLAEVERYTDDTNLAGRDAGEGWRDGCHKFMANLLLTDTTGAAFSETESSRARVPGRRSTPRPARFPCRSPHGARFRISANRGTT